MGSAPLEPTQTPAAKAAVVGRPVGWPALVVQLVVLLLLLELGMDPVQVLQPEPVPEAEPELARRIARESDHLKIHAVGWS